MSFAVSLVLIAVGAVLRFATNLENRGFNVHITGDILMVVGIIGFILALIYWVSTSSNRDGPVPPTSV